VRLYENEKFLGQLKASMGLLAPFVCLSSSLFFFFLHEFEYLTGNYSQPVSQPATGHTYNNLHRPGTPARSGIDAHHISSSLMPPLW
jgi:hypothetical protein